MLVKSKDLTMIRIEIDDACDDVYSDIRRFKDKGDEESRMIARMAYSHLLHTYLELMNAIDLIKRLESEE